LKLILFVVKKGGIGIGGAKGGQGTGINNVNNSTGKLYLQINYVNLLGPKSNGKNTFNDRNNSNIIG
jgi:hypothetical protein